MEKENEKENENEKEVKQIKQIRGHVLPVVENLRIYAI